ncbi:MAG: hypothetical protein GQ574_13135 [Crocinitomix sp.]|nr:hypothetical protein [Crocinitomix sp.]
MRIIREHISNKKIVLQMKSWRNHFAADELKEIIAIALNRTICETNTRLKGYFITDWRIYLVLNVSHKHENEFVDHFLNEMHQILIKYANDFNELELYFHEKDLYNNIKNLFRYYHFFDVRLYRLLIGEKDTTTFDDPTTAEMRAYLANYKYSSYLNYKGDKGPVIFPISKHRIRRRRER